MVTSKYKQFVIIVHFFFVCACFGDPIGTYYLNTIGPSQQNDLFIRSILQINYSTAGYGGTYTTQNGTNIVTNISYTSSQQLEFLRIGDHFYEWYSGVIEEGIFVGRFTHQKHNEKPSNWSTYIHHVTGWNIDQIDQTSSSRSYNVILDDKYHAKIHLDKQSTNIGRFKIYHGPNGEELEYDIDILNWRNHSISFTRKPAESSWVQMYDLKVNGRIIAGSFTDTREPGKKFSVYGVRWSILDFGLAPKSHVARKEWQKKTRKRIMRLIMGGNTSPILPTKITSKKCNVSGTAYGQNRDDNAKEWPQLYNITEVTITYLIPCPYGGESVPRVLHGYLAIPFGIKLGDKLGAVLALNGHAGSAWQMMFPPQNTIYWYGDAIARRKYIVFALDMSHRDHSVMYNDTFNHGDDPQHSNGPHPAILFNDFKTPDWEEDGERTWDAMRIIDYLVSLPFVDRNRIIATGLSMGGEITTFVSALDERIAMSIPAGFSPDMDVMYHHGNHPCWQFTNANVREYLDTEALHALVAPRFLIVQTGKIDKTYSYYEPPFVGDKQVARRTRNAFGKEQVNFMHYLHYDQHRWHVGDFGAAERFVVVPRLTEPVTHDDQTWQIDSTTYIPRDGFTLFSWINTLLGEITCDFVVVN
jgi:hypothetical protein